MQYPIPGREELLKQVALDMAKKDVSPDARIGLALSGGGFRASLYHLGTIRYLEEVGIMERVEVMSTVSGGSIIGAYYLIEMERRLRAKPGRDRLETCDDIIREFCRKLRLSFRMRALVFAPFFYPLQALLVLLRLRHPGDTMARAFERHLYPPQLRLGDLPVDVRGVDASAPLGSRSAVTPARGTRLLINTTSVVTGRRVVYSRESDMGIVAQIERSDPNAIPLARAVGASAAVPGLFKPLKIGNDVLADGGVVDNQGIESLLDYFELSEPSLNRLPEQSRQPGSLRVVRPDPDESGEDANGPRYGPSGSVFLIVSDGAGQFAVKDGVEATRVAAASRSMEILQSANRSKVLKVLLDTRDSTKVDAFGFAFTHLAMNIKGSPGADKRLPSEFIGPTAGLRTDLDDFSRLERDALIYHGYTLMRRQITTYGAPLLTRQRGETPPGVHPGAENGDFSWPPPFIELCDPEKGKEKGVAKARYEIEAFLRVGRSGVFRDVRRFPLVFAPLLLVFLGLGRYFAHLLTGIQIGERTAHEWIGTRIASVLSAMVPDVDIPLVIDLGAIRDGLQQNGVFWGTLDFASSVICAGLAFYVALWLYWMVKRFARLSERCEGWLVSSLRKGRQEPEAAPPESAPS